MFEFHYKESRNEFRNVDTTWHGESLYLGEYFASVVSVLFCGHCPRIQARKQLMDTGVFAEAVHKSDGMATARSR